MIPGVWAMGQFDSSTKFLSSIYHYRIPVCTQFATACLHVVWCKIFITDLAMKEQGAAIAMSLTYLANMIIADTLIRIEARSSLRHMIFWYDRSTFENLSEYLKVGIPSMLMRVFEWWAYETMGLVSGLLGVSFLVANVLVINVMSLVTQIPLGIGYAVSAIVGNYLGEGKVDVARAFSVTTI